MPVAGRCLAACIPPKCTASISGWCCFGSKYGEVVKGEVVLAVILSLRRTFLTYPTTVCANVRKPFNAPVVKGFVHLISFFTKVRKVLRKLRMTADESYHCTRDASAAPLHDVLFSVAAPTIKTGVGAFCSARSR